MKSDIITKIQTTYTPDGQGGYTEETIELGSFNVKLGVSNNVQEATSYGVSVEQILKVIADVPLLEDNSEAYIIIGPSGVDGTGVYYGEDEPPEGFEIWIDPNGEASDQLVLSVNEKTGHVVLDGEDVGMVALTNLEIEALLK